MQKFKALLDESFGSTDHHHQLILPKRSPLRKKPILTIIVRKETRVLLNLDDVIRLCNTIGFQVKIIIPAPEIPLTEIHHILSTSDVMVTVNGAAMTHFFFTRPGTVLIQIVPLGLNEAGDKFCGQPAKMFGLEYVEYRIIPKESSLSKEYGPNTAIISNPMKINRKGWQHTKKFYLGHQNITVDIKRFSNVVARVYETLIN